MSNYAGADWLQEQLNAAHKINPNKNPEVVISELGIKVANLLGEWQRGIYHMEHSKLYKANWESNQWIEVSMWCSGMSTYDFDDLTRLVFLAHEMALRVQLEPSAHHHVKLIFHPRSNDSDKRYMWHPNLDEAVTLFRQTFCVSSI